MMEAIFGCLYVFIALATAGVIYDRKGEELGSLACGLLWPLLIPFILGTLIRERFFK